MVAIPASVVPTFLDGVVRADAAVMDFVEGTSSQQTSPQIQKPLSYRLEPDEIAALRGQMGTVRMLTYRVDTLGADAASRRNLFAFAKTMGVTTILAPFDSDWPGLDALTDEAGINVAFVGGAAVPAQTMKALEGRSKAPWRGHRHRSHGAGSVSFPTPWPSGTLRASAPRADRSRRLTYNSRSLTTASASRGARPLSTRASDADVMVRRAQRALEQAARALEPTVRPLSIEKVTLRSEDDVRAWLTRTEAQLLAAVKQGPILVS